MGYWRWNPGYSHARQDSFLLYDSSSLALRSALYTVQVVSLLISQSQEESLLDVFFRELGKSRGIWMQGEFKSCLFVCERERCVCERDRVRKREIESKSP